MSEPKTVAIVGTGLIGCAWAAIFARAGWLVRLTDPHGPTLDAAKQRIADELRGLARHGLCDDPDGAAKRLTVARDLADAVAGVTFVQENGPEKVEDKIALFDVLWEAKDGAISARDGAARKDTARRESSRPSALLQRVVIGPMGQQPAL